MKSILVMAMAVVAITAKAAEKPNVLIVITDDQGYGDLGFYGNPVLKTPNLDAFAKSAVNLQNFYVCPVCSPTRSSLLTGLYNYRTGIVDTFIGRSLMRPGIPTLAEHLQASGYRTGLFGKWHLGDHYPLRPEDRGFQHTLWCQGGGLAQPSDHPNNEPGKAYFNPILLKNGVETKTQGYCTDVFTQATVDFMKVKPSEPFFAYVAYNAPHGPYQVPEEYAKKYAGADVSPDAFPKVGSAWARGKVPTEEIRKAYGMIENIDDNFAKLLKTLDDLKVADNTIVIFLTDNGPGGVRYNAGLKNRKGTTYDGGIRVPCFVRYPKELAAGVNVAYPAAHIDIVPTVLDLCGVKPQALKQPFDGVSVVGAIKRQTAPPERTLFFQWHRGDVPELGRAYAARGPRYKLVQANGVQEEADYVAKEELYDLQTDPYEQTDLALAKPEELKKLKTQYETWFKDVTKLGFVPPRIVLGNNKQLDVRLTRQDWRGDGANWTETGNGHWEVAVEKTGSYEVTVRCRKPFTKAMVTIGELSVIMPDAKEAVTTFTQTVELKAGDTRVSTLIQNNGVKRGADYVTLKKLNSKP